MFATEIFITVTKLNLSTIWIASKNKTKCKRAGENYHIHFINISSMILDYILFVLNSIWPIIYDTTKLNYCTLDSILFVS